MPVLAGIMQRLADNEDIITLIEHAIVDDPPVSITEGGIIREHFSGELDQLKQRMSELEERVDFAERLLVKQREAQRLGPPQD